MAAPGGIGANAFDEGTWYHEILEDGLALSYRVRVLRRPSLLGRDGRRRIGARRSRAAHPRRVLRDPARGVGVLSRIACRILVSFPNPPPRTRPKLTRASSRPAIGPTPAAAASQVEEVLHRGTSQFQTVEVVKTVPFGSLLITDGLMQSSEVDEYVYHQSLVHPALTAHPDPKKVFIAGGGEVRFPGKLETQSTRFRPKARSRSIVWDDAML